MMTVQHTRTDLAQAILKYQKKHLTATGLLGFYFEIKLAYGWTQRFKPEVICSELGISKSTFYKALSSLKADGFINFEVHGEISVTNTNPSFSDSQNPQNSDNSKAVSNRGQDSTISDEIPNVRTEIPNVRTEIHKFGQDSTISDSNSTISENESSKPASEGEWGDAPDYIQIYFKSFSNLLQGRGVDFEKQKKFFEWWTKEGRKKVGFLLNDPIAYLNSQDPISKEKRLFLQLLKYEETLKLPDWIQQLLNDPKRAHLVKLD